jgi:branched-subunit amino acid aminotransferase/4-amino-4-deoxychorismate lyase
LTTGLQRVVDEAGERSAPLGPLAPSVGWRLDEGRGCFTTGRVVERELLWRVDHRARLLADVLSFSPDLAGATGALASLERATDEALGSLEAPATLRWGLFLDDDRGWRWALTLEPERRQWCDLDRRFHFAAVEADVRWEAKTLDRSPQRALEARGGQPDGAVVLRDGRLCEGSWFNLALLKDGRWTLPEGVFPGLTGERLIAALERRGSEVLRADVEPSSLAAADAVVALSAVMGMGVVETVGPWACGGSVTGLAAVADLGSVL